MKSLYFFTVFFAVVFFVSCKDTTEDIAAGNISEYMPYQVGKYITYRLDSLVFTNSGSSIETHKYLVRHSVTGKSVDNAGNIIFIVTRTINNENGTGDWVPNGNYTITPIANRLETFDNNMRVINLALPMRPGYSWKGNSYLPPSPYHALFDMNAGGDMNTWDFTYTSSGDTVINNVNYADIWNIEQHNFVQNIPPPSPNTYGVKEVSSEKYAKGIGLIYKNFQLYDRQPGNVDSGNQPYYTGFGVTLWIVDHN